MLEQIRHPDGRIENPNVRFEPSDASFRWIAGILASAVVVLAVIHMAVMVFFDSYRNHLAEINRSPYPLAPGPSSVLPRAPRLEQIDRLSGDKKSNAFFGESEKLRILDSYGPTESDGTIHVPIDRAMQMIVEKKLLKARPAPLADGRDRSSGLVVGARPIPAGC